MSEHIQPESYQPTRAVERNKQLGQLVALRYKITKPGSTLRTSIPEILELLDDDNSLSVDGLPVEESKDRIVQVRLLLEPLLYDLLLGLCVIDNTTLADQIRIAIAEFYNGSEISLQADSASTQLETLDNRQWVSRNKRVTFKMSASDATVFFNLAPSVVGIEASQLLRNIIDAYCEKRMQDPLLGERINKELSGLLPPLQPE